MVMRPSGGTFALLVCGLLFVSSSAVAEPAMPDLGEGAAVQPVAQWEPLLPRRRVVSETVVVPSAPTPNEPQLPADVPTLPVSTSASTPAPAVQGPARTAAAPVLFNPVARTSQFFGFGDGALAADIQRTTELQRGEMSRTSSAKPGTATDPARNQLLIGSRVRAVAGLQSETNRSATDARTASLPRPGDVGGAPAARPAADTRPGILPRPLSELRVQPASATMQPTPVQDPSGIVRSEASPFVAEADKPCPTAEFCGECFCGPPGRFWFRGDYIGWWTSGMRLPPLVTTTAVPGGTTNDVVNDPAGSINRTDVQTRVLFGDSTIGTDMRHGFRVKLGMWLDACHRWGVEADYLDLGPRSTHFAAVSDASGFPLLARPFYDVQNGREFRQIVSYPGTGLNQVTGSITVDVNESFNSGGVTLRRQLCCCSDCCGGVILRGNECSPRTCRLDFLVGYRGYHLQDGFRVRETPRITQLDLTQIVVDEFRASNEFHGVDIGLDAQIYSGRWSFDILAKMALGNNHRESVIGGSTQVLSGPIVGPVQSGGFFALSTNSGTRSRDDFAVIPYLSLEVGYQITCRLRAYFGYSLLYWGCVQRSGDLYNLNIDTRNVPGATNRVGATNFPQFNWVNSCFWAQGINTGLEFRY